MSRIINPDTKSIRFQVKVDEKLTFLSLKLGRTKKDLFVQMVDYFYRTKKDPIDLNDELLKKEITSGISKILSFYRQQENDLILPQFEILSNMENSIIKLLDNIESATSKLNQLSLEQQSLSNRQRNMHTSFEDAKLLKTRFRKIFENYVAARESLGWNPSSRIKDELIKLALNQLSDL